MILDNDVVMMEEDDIIRYATELLDAVDNGWVNDDTKVDRFTYAHLVAMFLATSNMDNGAKLYSYCYDAAIRCGERHIKEKLSAGEKIKVAFLPISAAEWPAGGIYRLMADDDRDSSRMAIIMLNEYMIRRQRRLQAGMNVADILIWSFM